jgi:hypothetical protein
MANLLEQQKYFHEVVVPAAHRVPLTPEMQNILDKMIEELTKIENQPEK